MTDIFRSSPGDEEAYKFSPTMHAVTMIDAKDRLADDGFVFHASGKVSAMVDANVDNFLFVTPSTPVVHLFKWTMVVGAGDVDLQIYEAPTSSAAGAALTELNVNRNSSKTPGCVLTFGPTLSDDGTLLHTDWIPPSAAAIGQTQSGKGDEGTGEEWMLMPSTKYLFRVTNNSGETIDYRWEFAWMEPNYEV